jgi:hypothetical protein
MRGNQKIKHFLFCNRGRLSDKQIALARTHTQARFQNNPFYPSAVRGRGALGFHAVLNKGGKVLKQPLSLILAALKRSREINSGQMLCSALPAARLQIL